MLVEIKSTFVIENESDAERLKRQIHSIICEHGLTWNLETTMRIAKEGQYEQK